MKEVQKFLIDNGYDLCADGVWGHASRTAMRKFRKGMTVEQMAYVLATIKHETNGTFKPVREAYWLSEDWRKRNLRYYPYYGRGYVQITWETNYKKFSRILGGIDLVKEPDLALRVDVATKILIYGFIHGTFTGLRVDRYINDKKCDFVNARRCINGIDKASKIAGYAKRYLNAIS